MPGTQAVFTVTIALASFFSICIYYGPGLIDSILAPHPPSPESSSGQARQWGSHEEIDCNANGSGAVTAFELHLEDDALDDLKDRLLRWRPPGAPMDHGDGSWSYGANSEFMARLVRHWSSNYDWRKHEARINAMGLSETVVDGLTIRFHRIRRGTGARAVLLLHGWPGSIWEFHRLIDMLQSDDGLDGYDIVCPSLPGYGFSDAPAVEGYNAVAMAGTMLRLMKKIGYDQYIIQGGDWGSVIAQACAYLDPSPLIGLHLNFFPVSFSPGHLLMDEFKIRLFDDEGSRARAARSRDFVAILAETGYMHQQATKPETLGYALSDSPVGLCAWISEKFHSWSDPSLPLEDKFSMDDILTNCMIYWMTNSITSSMRLYKEQFRMGEANAMMSAKVIVPVALSLFPHELFPPADTPVKRKFDNIILFRKHDRGGHFAALEQPELLLQDLVEFARRVQQ